MIRPCVVGKLCGLKTLTQLRYDGSGNSFDRSTSEPRLFDLPIHPTSAVKTLTKSKSDLRCEPKQWPATFLKVPLIEPRRIEPITANEWRTHAVKIPRTENHPSAAKNCVEPTCKDNTTQTEPDLAKEYGNLEPNSLISPSFAQGLSSILHQLNIEVCTSADIATQTPTCSSGRTCSVPTLWLALSKLNYSPALYNLGVWHERELSCGNRLCRRKFDYHIVEAERWYTRAIEADNHPFAAYNLACLLLSTEKSKRICLTRPYTIEQLMTMASNGGVKQAKDFLKNHKKKPLPPNRTVAAVFTG